MSKRYNIRWSELDEKELKRVVKNFNAKISRLEKKDPKNKNVLPEKVSAAQLKELIHTRQDLNRELNSLKRFSQKGAEQIVKAPDNDYNLEITKWQKNEMSMRAAIVNRKRAKRLKEVEEFEQKQGQTLLGYTKGEFGMGKADKAALRPIKPFTPSMSRKEVNQRYKSLIKQTMTDYFDVKDMILKNNYINALKENFHGKNIKEIIDNIENMDFQKFYKIYQEQGGTMEIPSDNPNDGDEHDALVELLRDTWMD